MKPKEKAEELFNKYYSYLKSNLMDDKEAIDDAKQCALIAVDEILSLYIYQSDQWFYQEVKKEIEKL